MIAKLKGACDTVLFKTSTLGIGGLQPIPRNPKDNGVALPCWMTEPSVLSSNTEAIPLSLWISRDWLQTTYTTPTLPLPEVPTGIPGNFYVNGK